MELPIEQACVRDAERILKLQYLSYQTEAELYDDYAIPQLTQTLRSLVGDSDTHTILVARPGGEVVGSVRGRLEGDTCRMNGSSSVPVSSVVASARG